MLPRLLSLSKRAPEANILVVSRGGIEANLAKFNDFPASFRVVLQEHWEVSMSFELLFTPAAFLIDEAGIIASSPAIGGDAILNLFRALAIRSVIADA